jgi:hypothetical protein
MDWAAMLSGGSGLVPMSGSNLLARGADEWQFIRPKEVPC